MGMLVPFTPETLRTLHPNQNQQTLPDTATKPNWLGFTVISVISIQSNFANTHPKFAADVF
jgi:hypothetical protein